MASVYRSSADRKQKRNGIQVRVIEYKFKWIRGTGTYRLITTILDCEQAPADELAALYHERWEIETALGECKTKLKGSTVVMRSKTPDLVKQEFYGFMLTYFVIRKLMHDAALQAYGSSNSPEDSYIPDFPPSGAGLRYDKSSLMKFWKSGLRRAAIAVIIVASSARSAIMKSQIVN
jgi:hypothetical protein